MKKRIYILHEYGAPEHFRALKHLCNISDTKLYFREFTYNYRGAIKNLLLKGEIISIYILIRNFFFNFFLNYKKKSTIILGIAPFDSRLKKILQKCNKHQILYFTSWNIWDGSNQPYEIKNKRIYKYWCYFLQEKVTGLFFVSETARNNLLNNFNVKAPYEVVYHSVEKECYFPSKSVPVIENGLKLLYVGALTKLKGLEKIFQLIEQLQKLHITFTFSFVGDGPLKNKISELSKKLNNISYLGYIKDKHKLGEVYRTSHFLILPSRQELFGMVIIEAMACGLIPITTDNSGPKEIISFRENGVYFNNDSYVKETSQFLQEIKQPEVLSFRKKCIKTSKNYFVEELAEKWNNILKLKHVMPR